MTQLIHLVPAHLEGRGVTKRRCIMAARIGYELLKRFGIESTPVPVNVRAFNAVAFRFDPKTMTEEEGVAMGVRYIEIDTEGGKGGYAGHVVLRVGDDILDLNCGQVARSPFPGQPNTGIDAPPADLYVCDPAFWTAPAGTWHDWRLKDGGSIGYAVLADPPDFRDAIDWRAKGAWFPTVRDVGMLVETFLRDKRIA